MKIMMCGKQTKKLTKKPFEWDPPAPSTVYVKIKNIPYETFKIRLNEGLVTTELDQIRHRLERHIYCCGVCSKYVNGYCVVTNRRAEPEWICKSFVPKEEFIYLNLRPGSEDPEGFRYLSETGIRKDRTRKDIKRTGKGEEREDRDEVSQENTDVEGLYEEGAALYRQSRLRLALEAFDKVLSDSPQHFGALFHRGNALLKLKLYEDALETFKQASKINSNHAGLWTNIGFALVKLERLRQALEAFEKSISLSPVQKKAWEGKEAVIAYMHQTEEDLKESEKELEQNPCDADTLFKKGKLHLKLGELEQAREAFSKALKVKPGNADAWQLRGKILFETGLEKEALQAIEKAIKQKPDFPEAWYEKGRVFLKLGNPKSAENAFKIAANLWENKGLKIKAEAARQRVRKLDSGND